MIRRTAAVAVSCAANASRTTCAALAAAPSSSVPSEHALGEPDERADLDHVPREGPRRLGELGRGLGRSGAREGHGVVGQLGRDREHVPVAVDRRAQIVRARRDLRRLRQRRRRALRLGDHGSDGHERALQRTRGLPEPGEALPRGAARRRRVALQRLDAARRPRRRADGGPRRRPARRCARTRSITQSEPTTCRRTRTGTPAYARMPPALHQLAWARARRGTASSTTSGASWRTTSWQERAVSVEVAQLTLEVGRQAAVRAEQLDVSDHQAHERHRRPGNAGGRPLDAGVQDGVRVVAQQHVVQARRRARGIVQIGRWEGVLAGATGRAQPRAPPCLRPAHDLTATRRLEAAPAGAPSAPRSRTRPHRCPPAGRRASPVPPWRRSRSIPVGLFSRLPDDGLRRGNGGVKAAPELSRLQRATSSGPLSPRTRSRQGATGPVGRRDHHVPPALAPAPIVDVDGPVDFNHAYTDTGPRPRTSSRSRRRVLVGTSWTTSATRREMRRGRRPVSGSISTPSRS